MSERSARDIYVDAARRHSRGLSEGTTEEADATYDERSAALKQLRLAPDRGLEVLMSLLHHEDAGVRKSAATDLLPLNEEAALEVLATISKLPDLIGFDAKMVIREWKAGRLKIL